MTHGPRKKGESGYYHVVAKGAGSQVIFEETADRRFYLKLLSEQVRESKAAIIAYCLMSNHVHLLVRDDDDNLSAFMKRVDELYAMYFARKTGRGGGVFQAPFWSEAVETDEYLLAALRYIHANPEPAGICPLADYPWSSYRAYLGEPSFVSTDFVLELCGSVDAFVRFSDSGGKFVAPFPGSKLQRHLSPDEVWRVACALLGRDMLQRLKTLPLRERIPYLKKLSGAGFTESEIARLTGIGRTSIHRCIDRTERE